MSLSTRGKLFIAFLLSLPLLLLIAFTPTQVLVCRGTADFMFCRGEQVWVDNGVVLEVVVRWVLAQDWIGALVNALKVVALITVLVMFAVGLTVLLSEEPKEKAKNEPELPKAKLGDDGELIEVIDDREGE